MSCVSYRLAYHQARASCALDYSFGFAPTAQPLAFSPSRARFPPLLPSDLMSKYTHHLQASTWYTTSRHGLRLRLIALPTTLYHPPKYLPLPRWLPRCPRNSLACIGDRSTSHAKALSLANPIPTVLTQSGSTTAERATPFLAG